MKLRHRSAEQQRPGSPPDQFSLSTVMRQEVGRGWEQVRDVADLQDRLQELLAHQLAAFTREQLGMPWQPAYTLAVRPGGRWGVQLWDERYFSGRDMLAMAETGRRAATTPELAERYQNELEQTELFYAAVSQTMQQGEWQWAATEEGVEPAYWVGDKQFFTLPKSAIYPGDKAYIYFWRVLYVPAPAEHHQPQTQVQWAVANGTARGRWQVVMEPVFHDFSHVQLAHLHNAAARATQPESIVAPTETALMHCLSVVPSELQNLVGVDFFLGFFRQMGVLTAAGPYDLLARQQRINQLQTELDDQRRAGAAFLSKVFLYELQRLASGEKAATTALSARLHYALFLVMSPLLQNQPLSVTRCWRVYQEKFPLSRRARNAAPSPAKIGEVLTALANGEHPPVVTNVAFSAQFNQQLQTAAARISPLYLNNVVGNTMCTAMSFGDLTQRFAVLQQPLGQAVLNGLPVAEMAQLQQLVGQTEGWRIGVCRHPDCVVNCRAGHPVQQLVGPCQICASCQLRIEQADLQHFWQQAAAQSSRQDGRQLAAAAATELDWWSRQFHLNDLAASFLAPWPLFAPMSAIPR